MEDVSRDTFTTDGQYNKYLKIKSFFEKLIKLGEAGHFFMVDDEVYKTPFIEGVEMGFVEDNFRMVFTGCTHAYNKETEEYDLPWIDVTMKELRERIVPLKRTRL
jgi:hypothetical protein